MKKGRLILGGEPLRLPPVQLELKKKRQCSLTMKEELLRKRDKIARFRLFTLRPTLIMKKGRLILGGEPLRLPPVQLEL